MKTLNKRLHGPAKQAGPYSVIDDLKQEKLNAAARESIEQTKKVGRSPVYACADNPHQLLREHPDGTIEKITYADLEADNADS